MRQMLLRTTRHWPGGMPSRPHTPRALKKPALGPIGQCALHAGSAGGLT